MFEHRLRVDSCQFELAEPFAVGGDRHQSDGGVLAGGGVDSFDDAAVGDGCDVACGVVGEDLGNGASSSRRKESAVEPFALSDRQFR